MDTYYIVECANEFLCFTRIHEHRVSAIREAKRASKKDGGQLVFMLNSLRLGHIAFYNGKIDHVDGATP